MGSDFSSPTASDGSTPLTLNQTVNNDTVIELKIALNTLGRTLRWSWANGDLQYWQTTSLGQDGAELTVRLKPAVTPIVDWGAVGPNGCTATPILSCSIALAGAEYLSASLVLSLDTTLDAALTGAVFATQGALAGFLQPGGTPAAPVLDLQVASTHHTSADAPQLGVMKALIPAQALLNLYGVLPADAGSFFGVQRTGDTGTQSAPAFEPWTASEQGSDGLLVTVRDITFSAPAFRVKRKGSAPRLAVRIAGSKTRVTGAKVAACRRKGCTVTLLKLPSSRLSSKVTTVARGRSSADGSARLTVARGKLPRGTRVLLVLRRASGKNKGKLVTTAQGSVS
ncbi:unannotated protein [freshwater metagenome]|uniref:Unannotated protein n=1 Tax=freshwater metagenome TaxID=449393 RepID=A0A6J7ESR5_9ZZZZ|nr:hypothetical protein [Actinomycetota bacterium]